MMKLPSNWLKEGDWQGYIPQVQARVAHDAEMATALGRVRRALGDGVFGFLRDRMPEASLAMLDGIAFEAPAQFLLARPVQRTLLEKHCSAVERYLGETPTFMLVSERKAS